MQNLMTTVKSLLFLTIILTIASCGSIPKTIFEPVIDTKLVNVKVPNGVRTCADSPKSPKAESRTQKSVAVLIAKLDHAHANCKANLAVVDRILTEQDRKIDAFNRDERAKAKQKLKN